MPKASFGVMGVRAEFGLKQSHGAIGVPLIRQGRGVILGRKQGGISREQELHRGRMRIKDRGGIGAKSRGDFLRGGAVVSPKQIESTFGTGGEITQRFVVELLHAEEGFLSGSQGGKDDEIE